MVLRKARAIHLKNMKAGNRGEVSWGRKLTAVPHPAQVSSGTLAAGAAGPRLVFTLSLRQQREPCSAARNES